MTEWKTLSQQAETDADEIAHTIDTIIARLVANSSLPEELHPELTEVLKTSVENDPRLQALTQAARRALKEPAGQQK